MSCTFGLIVPSSIDCLVVASGLPFAVGGVEMKPYGGEFVDMLSLHRS